MQLPAAGYGTSRFIVMRINACIVTAYLCAVYYTYVNFLFSETDFQF